MTSHFIWTTARPAVAAVLLLASVFPCFAPPAHQPPTITVQPQGQTISEGGPVTFNVSVSGTAPFSYQWYYNGRTAIYWGTNASLTISGVPMSYMGNYQVQVINAYGSTVSQPAYLREGVTKAKV